MGLYKGSSWMMHAELQRCTATVHAYPTYILELLPLTSPTGLIALPNLQARLGASGGVWGTTSLEISTTTCKFNVTALINKQLVQYISLGTSCPRQRYPT